MKVLIYSEYLPKTKLNMNYRDHSVFIIRSALCG